MWESNPPEKLLTPQTGFEDQRQHQPPSTPLKLLRDTIEIIQYIVTQHKAFIQNILTDRIRLEAQSSNHYFHISTSNTQPIRLQHWKYWSFFSDRL